MTRSSAIIAGLFVAFLWSTSYILMKWAYELNLGPLMLSGLRFGLAVLVLYPVLHIRNSKKPAPHKINRKVLHWTVPVILGTAGYAVTIGGQNIGLYYLQAHQVTLILAVNNTLQSLLLSFIVLNERPSAAQFVFLIFALLGIMLYYYPWSGMTLDFRGIIPLLLAGTGYAIWNVGNRKFVGFSRYSALEITFNSMAWGALLLLSAGIFTEGIGTINMQAWLILLVLAVINTAFAFTVWTRLQGVLAAFESVMINNTMLIQISLLSLLLLNETPSGLQWTAIVIVSISVLLVQLTPVKVKN